MKQGIPVAFAVTLGIAGAAHADTSGAKPLDQNSSVVVVGEISSQPRSIGFKRENKMQVAVGPEQTDHTFHLKNAKVFGPSGQEMFLSDLQDKMWVRAEGRLMKDNRRIEVTRLQVLGNDWDQYRQSSYFRPETMRGYVMNVAGERQTFTDTKKFSKGMSVVLVGPITSPPKGELNEQKMQVAIGSNKTDYTLHFKDATLLGVNGQKIDEDALDDGHWVRAEGTVMDDARRIQVTRLQVVAEKPEGYKGSTFFRQGFDHGYAVPASEFNGTSVNGISVTPVATKPLPAFSQGSSVVIVGPITSPPKGELNEQKMQVAIGSDKTDYTLHFKDATLLGVNGEKIDEDALDDGHWVRAEGIVMDDARRIQVTRLQVVAEKPEGYKGSTFFRQGHDYGYVVPASEFNGTRINSVTASPNTFAQGTPVVLVGEITSQPRDVGVAVESKMQVGVGANKTDYTLHLKDAQIYSYHGTKVGKDHFQDKMWVLAEGRVMDDSKRIQVDRIQVVAGNDIGYRKSESYRKGFEYGYVMPAGANTARIRTVTPQSQVAGERDESRSK